MLVGAGAVGFINMEVTAVAVVFVAPVASLVVVSGVAARLVARLVVAGVDSGVGRKGVVGRLHKTVAARRKNNTHDGKVSFSNGSDVGSSSPTTTKRSTSNGSTSVVPRYNRGCVGGGGFMIEMPPWTDQVLIPLVLNLFLRSCQSSTD